MSLSANLLANRVCILTKVKISVRISNIFNIVSSKALFLSELSLSNSDKSIFLKKLKTTNDSYHMTVNSCMSTKRAGKMKVKSHYIIITEEKYASVY